MKFPRWAALFLSLALLAISHLQAADLRVQPTEIRDTRCGGKFGSSLDITFNLFGDELEHGRAVRCNLTKAVDETGRELIETDKSSMHGMSRNGDFSPSNEELTDREQISVQLKNPSRKATVVTEIYGEIEIFKPKNDPQSVLLVKDLAGKSKKPLADPLLAANKIEITLSPPKASGRSVAPCEPCVPAGETSAKPQETAPLPGAAAPIPEASGETAAKPSADGQKEPIAPLVEAKETAKKTAESNDDSADEAADDEDDFDADDLSPEEAKKIAPDLGKAMGGALEQAFSHMFGGGGDENSFQMTIKDPSNKLVKIEFLDDADQVISNNGTSSCNDQHEYYFSRPLPKNVKLRIYMATEKSIVKVPFTLKDVALP